MATFGTDTRWGAPTAFQFTYDGAVQSWGTENLLSINDISNQADPIDGKIQVSDMTLRLIDPDGSIWTALGAGTTCFGKDVTGTVYVGGLMEEEDISGELGPRFKKTSEAGAWESTVHVGKVTNASKSNDIVEIRSENKFNLLDLVKWNHPVTTTPGDLAGHGGGTAVISGITEASLAANNAYYDGDGTYIWASLADTAVTLANFAGTGIYDTSQGTGINSFLASGYSFVDDQFYDEYPKVKFALTAGLRIKWPDGTAQTSKLKIYPLQRMNIVGDPTAVLRHCLFGSMVSSYYNQDADMGQASFEKAAEVTAFQVFDQFVDPGEDKVLDYITEINQVSSALFFASADSKFQFHPYGPKNVQADLDVLGSNEIISASFTNDIKDYYNKVSIEYNWDLISDQFLDKWFGTQSDWSKANDRPLEISSQWLKNSNQARNTGKRLLERFKQTSPKVHFTTTMASAGRELGSLVKVRDSQAWSGSKIVQLVDYNKSFSNSNTVDFTGYDGDALFLKKGYAQWEDANDLTALTSGTSTAGWGTLFDQTAGSPFTGDNGTCLNINEDYYGTVFNFW